MENRASQILHAAFKERGKQRDIAAATGISQSWLSRLAKGEVANRDDALKLKAELGIELEWWDEAPVESVGSDPHKPGDAA